MRRVDSSHIKPEQAAKLCRTLRRSLDFLGRLRRRMERLGFPPDDPLYGTEPPASPPAMVNLGRLSPRGEKGVLTVPSEVLMRLSSNPFFSTIAARTTTFIAR